jgi:hypothetical protein
MLDQAVSSLSNVVVAVIVARVVAPEQFGAFSVAVIAYAIALGAVRALVGEPWLSTHSSTDPSEPADPADSTNPTDPAGAADPSGPGAPAAAPGPATGTADLVHAAVAASLAAGVVVMVFALTTGGALWRPLVALTLFFPALAVQDSLRHVAVVDRPEVALASDVAWLAAVIPLLVAVPGDAEPAWFIAAWGAGGLAGLVVAVHGLRVRVSGGSAGRWFSSHREMAGAFFGEFVTARAVGQAVLLALGGIAGLGALGAIRAAQVFYGPLNMLFAGAYLALVPDGARRRHEPQQLVRLMATATGLLAGAALVWTVVGLALPDAWGVELFGDTWHEADDVMVPMGLAVTAGTLSTGAFAGIRSLGAARVSLRVRLWSMPPQAGLALAGAAAGAALGYALGLTAGYLVVAVLWWSAFASTLREPGGGAEPTLQPATGPGATVGLG